MGASAIITGLSSSIAQTLVDLGVDLSMMQHGRRPPGRPRGGRAAARRPVAATSRAAPDAGRRQARGVRSPILRQGDYLIASIQSDLSDREVLALRDDLAERVGELRARGIIVDVAALDVIDSFVARSLRSIAMTAQLRGAETVIVGIQPDVAIAMVQFNLDLEPLRHRARPRRGARAARRRAGRRGAAMAG